MLNAIMTPNLVLGDIKSMKRGKIGIFLQNTVAFIQGSDYQATKGFAQVLCQQLLVYYVQREYFDCKDYHII